MIGGEVKVLPGGWIRLLETMGDDLSIVNAARQSYGIEHEAVTLDDEKLIDYLVKNRHGTPTEMVSIQFQVQAPIPVAREWMRHRWANFNEISARYVKMELGFYTPAPEAIRTQEGKPGHYVFKPVKDKNVALLVAGIFEKTYNEAYAAYEELLDLGIAKELARYVLPIGIYTRFTCQMNGRSLMNFLSLRNSYTAMYEIRLYAQALEDMFAKLCPITYKAFITNGRTAP